jgi:hypothetical protein
MEDFQPVERRTATEMAKAIAGGSDVLQPAVGAMDRDPRPGRRAAWRATEASVKPAPVRAERRRWPICLVAWATLSMPGSMAGTFFLCKFAFLQRKPTNVPG